MFSVCDNCCIKLEINQNTLAKNIKNLVFILLEQKINLNLLKSMRKQSFCGLVMLSEKNHIRI